MTTWMKSAGDRSFYRLRVAALVGVSFAAIGASNAAWAQSSPPATEPTVAAPPETARPANGQSGSDIVVTGSRIHGNASSPVPMQNVSSADIQSSGGTKIGDVLANLPSIVTEFGSTTSNASNVGGGGHGLSTIALRGLGPQRTLVLLNGRRIVSGVVGESAVDLNTIPSDFIERVDVVTGGASAIYGSEAIAGVVNIITRRSIDGLLMNAQYGTSERGDGEDLSLSLSAGSTFAGNRGHFIFNVSYERLEPIFSRDRAFSKDALAINTVTGVLTPALIPSAPGGCFTRVQFAPAPPCFGGPAFNWDGTPFNLAANGIDTGDFRGIQVPLTRYIGSAQFDYQLTGGIRAFGEFSYAHTLSRIISEPTALLTGLTLRFTNPNIPPVLFTIPANNPLIPTALIQALYGSPTPPPGARLNVARNLREWGARASREERQTVRAVLGLDGSFDLGSRPLHWEIYGSYGRMVQDHQDRGQANQLNLEAAFNIIPDPARPGSFICADPAARASGCVPLNIWGPNAASPQAVEFTRHTAMFQSVNEQKVVAVNFDSQPFELWAGPVGLAVGAEWRNNRSSFTPDSITAASQSTLGRQVPLAGEITVREAYIEASVPLVRNVFLVDSLIIDGAYRITDYSTVGSQASWRVGFNWTVVDGLRFRGTRAKAIRAPNVTELYSPGAFTINGPIDPCDRNEVGRGANPAARLANCTAAIPGYNPATFTQGVNRSSISTTTFGNTNLEAERANTYTVGVVAQPRFIPGLTFTADYYNIVVDNAIQQISGSQLVIACYDANDYPNAFCGGVVRNPVSNQITQILTRRINFARIQTAGIDFQASYTHTLGRFGRISFDLTGNRLTQFVTSTAATLAPEDRKGVIRYPEWSGRLRTTYDIQNFSIGWTTRFIDSVSINPSTKLNPFPGSQVPSAFYHDLNFSVDLVGGRFRLFGGVRNIFDRQPPIIGQNVPIVDSSGNQTSCNTACDTYDPIGRYFYAGIRARI
jgi:iron complex outermembrane receptor protein